MNKTPCVDPIEDGPKGAIVAWKRIRLRKYKSRAQKATHHSKQTKNHANTANNQNKKLSHCLPSKVLRQFHKCEPRAHWSLIAANRKGPHPSTSQERNCLRPWPAVARFTPALQRRGNNTLASGHGKHNKNSIPTHKTKRPKNPRTSETLEISFSCISVLTQEISGKKYKDYKHNNK